MEIADTPLPPINIFLRSSEYTSRDIYKSNYIVGPEYIKIKSRRNL